MSAKIHSTETALAGRMDTGGSGICGRPEARIAKASGVAAPDPALPCSPDTGRGTASPFRASDQSPADLDPARTAFDGLLCRTHYRQRADEVPGACHNKDKAWTILVPGIAKLHTRARSAAKSRTKGEPSPAPQFLEIAFVRVPLSGYPWSRSERALQLDTIGSTLVH